MSNRDRAPHRPTADGEGPAPDPPAGEGGDRAAGWPAGAGAVARLIRGRDWAATALGPREGWPQSLRTAVSMVLYSDFPPIVLWGPDLLQTSTDPYPPPTDVFHSTVGRFASQSVLKSSADATPSRFGPRYCGQSAARAGRHSKAAVKDRQERSVRMAG